MKIEAVKLMRSIRDRISVETDGMIWTKERKYLNNRIHIFGDIANKAPDQPLRPISGVADTPPGWKEEKKDFPIV